MQRRNPLWSFTAAAGALLLVLTLIPEGHAQYDETVDFDGNGVIDYLDLFEAGETWQAGQPDDTLFRLYDSWHGTGSPATPTPTLVTTPSPSPTPTPTSPSGTTPVLSLEELVPVELTEAFPGTGVFTGEAEVAVSLSEVNAVAEVSLTLPLLLQDAGENYSATLVEAEAAGLFAGADPPDITQDVTGQTITLSTDTPVSGSGAGQVMVLTFSVLSTGTTPLPEDVVIPLPINGSEVLDGASSAIAHDTSAGSLLVNPSGSLATPTPGGNTPTPSASTTPSPTPTVTPAGGTAESVLLTICRTEALAGEMVEVYVDLLDAQGRIVNPGTPGGAGAVDITLTVTGSAQFGNGLSQRTETLEDPFGLLLDLENAVAETVTVEATAPGLNPATPALVTFTPSGNISGTVTLSGQPARPSSAIIRVLDAATGATLATAVPQIFTGAYSAGPLAPGTCDVSFEPGITTTPITGSCVTGVAVQGGQTTSGVDADLVPRTGGFRVSGSVSARDGSNLTSITVTLAPTGDDTCGKGPYSTTSFSGAGAASFAWEILQVPAETYEVNATAVGTSTTGGGYVLLDDVTVVVTDAAVSQDLAVSPSLAVEQLAPVNFARVSGGFDFQWEAPAGAGTFTWDLLVANRCQGIVWQESGITGTSRPYGGPALSPDTYYFWTVTGTNDTNTAFATGTVPQFGIPYFLSE